MFWNKKTCISCDSKINSDWSFCPSCGIGLKEGTQKAVAKEINQFDKAFEMNAPKFLVRRPVKTKGVSITITSDNFSPPKIDVKTYGQNPQQHVHHHHHVEEKPVRVAKTTEEPKTKIKRVQNKQIITLDMPDVKSLEDIEIKQLQQSIEIKAFAGDKAYFKLIPVPSNATVNNEFKDGVLKIEVLK